MFPRADEPRCAASAGCAALFLTAETPPTADDRAPCLRTVHRSDVQMPADPPSRLEPLEKGADGRRFSPSAARNREHIVAALEQMLPESGTCLEVAAGSGEHAALAAQRMPRWQWLATDRDDEALTSIEAWVQHVDLPNLKSFGCLDLNEAWSQATASINAVFASNLTHISPIETTAALFRGAAAHLERGGAVILYGPVFLPDRPRPESNVAFDAELRAREPSYGVRELGVIAALATKAGFASPVVREMPANNVMLNFGRR